MASIPHLCLFYLNLNVWAPLAPNIIGPLPFGIVRLDLFRKNITVAACLEGHVHIALYLEVNFLRILFGTTLFKSVFFSYFNLYLSDIRMNIKNLD